MRLFFWRGSELLQQVCTATDSMRVRPTPTKKRLRADKINEQSLLKYSIKKGEIFNLALSILDS
jgi:hypothetical protein